MFAMITSERQLYFFRYLLGVIVQNKNLWCATIVNSEVFKSSINEFWNFIPACNGDCSGKVGSNVNERYEMALTAWAQVERRSNGVG